MPIEGQSPKLKKLADDLSKAEFGQTSEQAVESGCCIECKLPALPRCYSEAGKREFRISGMCEICFDKMFED